MTPASRLLAVLFLLPLLEAAGPAAQPATGCAALAKAYPGAPCSFDLTKFRLRDPLLEAVERGATKGLFDGRKHVVHDAGEVAALRGQLRPGDEVVLADGEWRDAALDVRADGTPAHPIYIHAQHDGGAVFTGTASAAFSGSNLVVRGLAFRRGAVTDRNFVVFRLGNGVRKPCDRCIADRIVIDGYNSAPERYDTLPIFYLVLGGRDITVANSTFADKKNLGTMLLPELPNAASTCARDFASAGLCYQRLLFLHNKISGFATPRLEKDGPHKVMQLGSGEVATQSAFSALIGNTIENATADADTVCIKASDVLIRGNVFRANRGGLDLRAANRVLVENNVFEGAGAIGMAGVRIEGAGHWIVHNLFKGLVKPANYFAWPISIHTAKDEDLRDGIQDYARAKNIVIAGNRFQDDLSPPIVLGIYPDAARGRTLTPQNIYVLGNAFSVPGTITYIGDHAQYSGIVERGNTN